MKPKNERLKNLQTKQPGLAGVGNEAWPEALVDASDPVKYSYRDGKSGTIESRSITNLKTDQ